MRRRFYAGKRVGGRVGCAAAARGRGRAYVPLEVDHEDVGAAAARRTCRRADGREALPVGCLQGAVVLMPLDRAAGGAVGGERLSLGTEGHACAC